MAAGCVTVPTYTTNTTRDHQHILANSGASAVIVSTQKLAQHTDPGGAVLVGLPSHHFDRRHHHRPVARRRRIPSSGRSWSAAPSDIGALEARMASVERDDLACLIYTSGTGGAPRGVMQHHGMILHNVEGCIDVIANDFGWDDEVFLSFLPASHAYEHTGGQHFPIALGGQIYYAESLEKLAANIEEVQADDHGRRAAPVRNAARQDHEADRKGWRASQISDAPRALDRGQALRRQVAAVGPADGRPAVGDAAQEGARALRRADEGDGVGRRAAQPRRRPVLPGDGAAAAAGLWPDRGRAGDQLQPAQGRDPDGNGRPAADEYRGPDRRRRRDHGPRRECHDGLLAQRAAERARCSATAGWRPAMSGISTPRAGSSSPTARRT